MRQVFIQVPDEHGQRTKDIIQQYDPVNLAHIVAESEEGQARVFIANFSNQKIEGLFSDLNDVPETRITLVPHGVYAFRLETAQIPDQVTDIELLSPIEVFLSGLQSIGSFKGFLGYAAAAGVLVWLGLFINSVVLLIAGMLVAPLAGPAMNLSIAIARGDMILMRRSMLRYVLAIGVALIISVLLTSLTGLNMVTQQMDSMSQVSNLAVLIPLVIGTGGALSLIQSKSSSLVSGTVSGLLIAASLAPPVSLIGIGAVLGEWGMVQTSIFLVLLQLVGINLTGTVVLRLNNLKSRDAHYNRGKPWLFPLGIAVNVIVLAGLLLWQHSNPPQMQRASVAQQAANDIKSVIDDNSLVYLIELDTRFTRTDVQGQNSLLINVYVQPHPETTLSTDEIEAEVKQLIRDHLAEKGYDVTPLIDVSVVYPPEAEP